MTGKSLRTTAAAIVWTLTLVWLLAACGDIGSSDDSSASVDGEAADGEDWYEDGDDTADGDWGHALADGDESSDDLPPEQEQELRMSLPKTGKDFVFILNNEIITIARENQIIVSLLNLPPFDFGLGRDVLFQPKIELAYKQQEKHKGTSCLQQLESPQAHPLPACHTRQGPNPNT